MKKKKSNPVLMVVSLLAALLLWVYVVTIVNPEGEVTLSGIPVRFTGEEMLREDQKLVIVEGDELTVTAHFSGKNSELKKLEQNQSEIYAVVDVSKIRNAKEYTLAYDFTLPNAVQQSAITVFEKRPSTITFTVQRLITKPVEVVGDFANVEIADGYMLDSRSFDFDTVTVEGPEDVVNAIACAQVTMQRTNLDKSVTETLQYTLLDAEGNAVDTSELTMNTDVIEVTLNVVKHKTVPLDVELIDGGGATSKDVAYEIEPKSITLSGDSTVLDALNKIVLGNIDLAQIRTNTEVMTFPIVIPDGAQNVSGEEQATVTVRIKNKQTASIRATNIAFINTAEGLSPNSVTQMLQVTVRAGTGDIEKITSSSLRVVADLSECTQAGTYQVPVEIYIDGYPEAGVIGEYSIAVTLAKVEEPAED